MHRLHALAAAAVLMLTLSSSAQEIFPVDGPPVSRKVAGTFCGLPGTDVPGVVVPKGFCVRKFTDVPTPRILAFSPSGDLFVSSPSEQTPGGAPPGLAAILVLPDDDADGLADGILTYASGAAFRTVHGLAFRNGELDYAVQDAVYGVPYRSGDRLLPSAAPTKLVDMTDLGVADRWTKSLAAGSDGSLYVARGQYDNDVCPTPNPRSGSFLRIGPGHDPHGDVVATGMRDPLYVRCMPWGNCYGAELSGDGWDGIGGKEKLVDFHDGDNYGYPCCVNRDMPNPFIKPAPDCSMVGVAVQSFALHDTPFGFDWDWRNLWPAPYKGGFFVGLHGVFFSWTNTGLEWAPADPVTHVPAAKTEVFLSGFGRNGPVVGRVTDVVFAPDGRLFFCDDAGGAVYWIAPRSLRIPKK